jgi:hypothetical protein
MGISKFVEVVIQISHSNRALSDVRIPLVWERIAVPSGVGPVESP